MNKQMQIFENETFGALQVLEIEGSPWFIGKEVADILGYENTRDALFRHVDSEDKNTVAFHDGIPGNPNKTIINESGLYALIFGSKLPAARAFKRWVTSVVLPSIRKHGAYISPEVLEEMLVNTDFAKTVVRQLHAEQSKNEALLDRVVSVGRFFLCHQHLKLRFQRVHFWVVNFAPQPPKINVRA